MAKIRVYKVGGNTVLWIPSEQYNQTGIAAHIFRMIAAQEADISLAIWTLRNVGLPNRPQPEAFRMEVTTAHVIIGENEYRWELVQE